VCWPITLSHEQPVLAAQAERRMLPRMKTIGECRQSANIRLDFLSGRIFYGEPVSTSPENAPKGGSP
jgi:hypothetical protein